MKFFSPFTRNYLKYDLRELHLVRLSSDTWDGTPSPQNGWATAYYFCGGTCLFEHGRGYVDGIREMRYKSGDEKLVDLLFSLKGIFDTVCEYINKCFYSNEDLPPLELTVKSELIKKLVPHPTWQNLLGPRNLPVILTDEEAGTITVTVPKKQ